MKKHLPQWVLTALLTAFLTVTAAAAPAPAAAQQAPVWKCVHVDGSGCYNGELNEPWYKQIFLTSSGFTEAERADFWSEFDRIVALMTGPEAGDVWSVQHSYQLLFVGYFVPGGRLGTATAAFGGKITQHPIRGYATSLSQQAVYDKVAELAAWEVPGLNPFTAGVLFNSFQTPVTANASPPSFVQKSFGVAKFTRADLNQRGAYITTHELAHAGLNFLDEYVEQGFQNLSIRQIDVGTPLALFDWSWGGFVRAISDLAHVYDYNISEILAANGNDNIALGPWPATVYTPGYGGETYAFEGGMFFGRGTFHMAGDNLMNGDLVVRGPGDSFGFAHSPSQQRVVNQAFWGWSDRPNDRLRNAGPKDGWPAVFGSSTHVMLYDGDKNHHFQPTRSYTVQIGWYDRQWRTCWASIFPYPCYDDVWRTAETQVTPAARSIDLKMSSLYGLVNLAQSALCAVGVSEIPKNDGSGQALRLCDQDLSTVASNFLPTVKFAVPYQDVTVPASQWMTTYWWRFSASNDYNQSGWTGWSSFFRSL